MRYHNITKDDMLNGDGLRVVLWVAGCAHACPGCHNPVTWDSEGGLPFDEAARREIYEELEKDYVSDPLHPANIRGVTELARQIRSDFPDKTIWLYTGSTWNGVRDLEVARYVDVLVDGTFQEAKKDNTLRWKGSSNQQVIDVQKTLKTGEVVLHG